MALGIFMTPYILLHLGTEGYAAWALINIIISYTNLIDTGIDTSFVKYIAQFYARNENHNLNYLINTGLNFYGITGLIIFLIAIWGGASVLKFLNVPSNLLKETTTVLYISVFALICNNLGSVFNAIPMGLQRIDISTKLKMGLSLPLLTGTIVALELGYGLLGLVINTTIWSITHNCIAIIIAYHLLPELKISFKYTKKEFLKEMFQYGSKLHASRIASMVNFHFDKLLISKFSSIDLISFYEIGSKILVNLRSIFLSMIQVIMPAVSELNAKGETQKIKTLYLRTTKYLVLFSLPCFAISVSVAHIIVEAWIGPGFDLSALVLRILAIGYFSNLFGATISFVVQGAGKPEIQMRAAFLSLTLNITLSIILFFFFGFNGVMLGTSCAMTITLIYYLVQFNRIFCFFKISEILILCLKPLIASSIASGVLFAINNTLYEPFFQSSRLHRIGMLTIDVFCFFLIYILLILMLRYLNTEDKALLNRIINRHF